ncbi:hypothetical protein QBC40DRAFT_330475 [Triangularia verruculosa]|uniref:Uncharacterized protein n=1 Tax=Triangularia verruculosa TaxID=2587418 RepID=A0AAN6XER2_9PEZI|nr:hypothetical protein QBC40DRAFT_330475 [Triangularia verruculosa]
MSFLRSTTFRRKRWEDPELSCGEIITTSRLGFLKKAWGARGPALERFDAEIVPNIEDVLRNIDIGYVDIFVRLYMIGTRQETSRPIIMICCTNPLARSLVEDAVRNSSIPERFPDFGIGASALPLEQPVPARALAGGIQGSSFSGEDADNGGMGRGSSKHDIPIGHSTHSSRLVGRRINFKYESNDSRPFRCATGGAVIRLDSYHYQLSVNHIHEDTEADKLHPTPTQELSPMDFEDCHFDGMSEDEDSDQDTMETDVDPVLARASVTPTAESQSWAESPSSNSATSATDIPTERSFRPSPAQASTKPSNLDPIRSRTVLLSDLKHPNSCLDFALIPLLDKEVHHSLANTISVAQDSVLRELKIQEFAGVGKRMDQLIIITTRYGIAGKLAIGALYHWNSAASKTHKLYPINLSTPIEDGDSGSAVIDSVLGHLYGHIVRGCPQSLVAYMVAATEVFDHLHAETGLKVHLCGSPPPAQAAANLSQIEAESRLSEVKRWQQYAQLAHKIKGSSDRDVLGSTYTRNTWSTRFGPEVISGNIQGHLSPLLEYGSSESRDMDDGSDDKELTIVSDETNPIAHSSSTRRFKYVDTPIEMEPISEEHKVKMTGLSITDDNRDSGMDEDSSNQKTPS